MLVILFFWVIVSLVFLSFGRMFISMVNILLKRDWKLSVFDIFWLGLCSVGSLVTILSLFLPVNIYVLSGFIIVAVIYWMIQYRPLVTLLRNIRDGFLRLSIWFKVSFVSVLCLFVAYSLFTCPLYDMGLYHLQNMMWIEEFSVVPGLGNLHGRLAFNSNSILLQTLFSYHPSFYSTYFLLYPLCFFVFSSWVIKQASLLGTNIASAVLVVFLFVFIYMFKSDISTTSTDILAAIFLVYILLNLLLEETKDSKMFALSVMTLYCITLKLSTAPIGLVVLLGWYYFYKTKNIKAIGIVVLLGCIIFVPWLTRYIILSGYLIYPYPEIDIFNFDWKMPLNAVANEKAATLAWARIKDPDAYKVLAMPFSEWFPEWLKIQSSGRIRLYLLALVSPIFMLFSWKLYKKNPLYLFAWVIAFTGAAYGFMTAPDFRFSAGFTFAAGFIPLVILGYRFELKKISKIISLIIVPAVIVICIYLVLLRFTKRDFRDNRDPDYPVFSYVLKPQPMEYFKGSFGNSDVLTYELKYTDDETPIYVGVGGDQCFEKDLLCTCDYYFKQHMVKRGKSLQDGFRVKE